MPNLALRALLGCVAAVISALTFYQAMTAVLHALALPGLTMPAAFPTDPLEPFGIPRIVNDCLLYGLCGLVFGLVWPWLPGPGWLRGLGLGIVVALIGLLGVPVFRRYQPGAGWLSLSDFTTLMTAVLTYGLPASLASSKALIWSRSLLLNGFWGIGSGIVLPLLLGRGRRPT